MKPIMLLISLEFVSIVPITLLGCSSGSSVNSSIVFGKATVRASLESGYYLVTAKDSYKPRNLPEEFEQNGLHVSFRGRVVGTFKDPFGSEVYPVIELIEINKL